MRRIRKNLDQWTARILDIPKDITMDLPRLTMVGNVQLHVENHRGVLDFTEEYLRLALSKGTLEVRGKDLSIRTIMTEEVMVVGAIFELKYTPA